MKDVAQNTKDTSGKILKAAAKLFARYGYDGVSVKAISREAGANSALISYYYGGKPGLYQAVLKQQAETLLRWGVKNVFISLGAEGVYYAGREETGVMPAKKLPAVPLTGAGDALCAGLTLALAEGRPLRECARLGCQAAHDALLAARG